jgi:hypothetical protein
MGGENAANTRRRESGKACCVCRAPLDPPLPGYRPGPQLGERFCSKHEPREHELTMRFERVDSGWLVKVLRGRDWVLRNIRFASAEKVLAMAEAGGAFKTLADRQAVEFALQSESGKGQTTLRLTRTQLCKLTESA